MRAGGGGQGASALSGPLRTLEEVWAGGAGAHFNLYTQDLHRGERSMKTIHDDGLDFCRGMLWAVPIGSMLWAIIILAFCL